MKYLLTILLLLFSFISFSQSRGFTMKGDTLIYIRGEGDTVRTTNSSILQSAVSLITTALGFKANTSAISNIDNTSDANKPVSTATQTALNLKANLISPAFTGTPTGITATHIGLGNVSNTSDAAKPVSTATQTALDLKANLASPAFTGTPTGITSTHVGLGNVNNTSDASKPISTLTQTALDAKQATLVSGSNIKTVNGTTLLGSADITTTRKVIQVDIAATANATNTTTLFTPTVSGFYRVAIYLKISTTGTSPVAGPVTVTYTEPDGSVAQSHVMLLQSVTGTVVTTTVNNSTTTGTVNGSMIIYAKTGVAITYAIAVSGTFGAGRYIAHITCEAL